MAYVQMRRLRAVKTGELATALRLSASQERLLLSRMARSGMIASVRRGLFLFPATLPLGGLWSPDDALAINTLMRDKQARYQITGLSAFNRYGYDEQIAAIITLYNTAISGERTIGQTRLSLVKVAANRLGDTEQITTVGGETLIFGSRTRILIDAVCDWSRFDSLPRAYEWIRRDLESKRVAPEELAKDAIRYGNVGTIRRIGALLELMGTKRQILDRLKRALPKSKSKIPWVPGRRASGRLLKNWGVIVNG